VVFLDAPLELPQRPGDSLAMRCWWRSDGPKRFEGWETTLASLERAWDERGPFAGVIGFSQGAAVAFLLALLAETADRDAIARGVATDEDSANHSANPGDDAMVGTARFSSLDFFILCSGYVPAPSPVRNPHGIQPVTGARIGEGTSPRACLVIAGEKDEAVPVSESVRAAAWFKDSQTSTRADGKHEVSSRAEVVDALVSFVASRGVTRESATRLRARDTDQRSDDDASSDGFQTAHYSEEVREEIEALRSIFDGEMRDATAKRTRGPRAGEDGNHAPLAFAFSLPCATEIFGNELASNPAFVLELPRGYPETQTPRVRAKRGLIGVAPFLAAAFRDGLDVAVADATRDLIGTPSTFSAVSEAREWLEEAMRAYASENPVDSKPEGTEAEAEEEATETARGDVTTARVDATRVSGDGDDSSDDDADAGKTHRWWECEEDEGDDAAVSAAIADASAEAARAALADAEKRRGRLADPASVSSTTGPRVVDKDKGGRWEYVIGLVGKPSAGKSTFFNSAAAFADSDANAAKVAAYPFTTIEPNVAEALAAFPCACLERGWSETCQPKNGAVTLDGKHKRLARVRIKDVAGLVPGAHRGRGRGNAFLNDLCDADVLVHVVDASGRSDKDGVDHTGGGAKTAFTRKDRDAFVGKESKDTTSSSSREEYLRLDHESHDRDRDPAGDVGWVRDELHAWIFANVRAKWRKVRRRPERLRELFSGYHSSPNVADAALRKCGVLDPRSPPRELLQSWTKNNLHVLVAHFLRLRFPTLLALNKRDVPESKAHAKKVKLAWPAETCVDVSARDDPESVRRAVAAAIALKPPIMGFPVDCLDTGVAESRGSGVQLASLGGSTEDVITEWREKDFREKTKTRTDGSLRSCVLLKPGSTVEDFFDEARRIGLCGNGELVRSETSDIEGRRRTLRRDELVAAIPGGVVKFYVNRKVKWQGKR
jgi:ribosome-binding ATPase YchF (GTP1/OBG family)/predicted esterase